MNSVLKILRVRIPSSSAFPLVRSSFFVTQFSNMNVSHDENDKKFFVKLEKGEALLEYAIEDGKTINMYHTEVPDAYRGKGIAKELVKEALKFAVDHSLKIKPTCSYVEKYLRENPDSLYNVVQ